MGMPVIRVYVWPACMCKGLATNQDNNQQRHQHFIYVCRSLFVTQYKPEHFCSRPSTFQPPPKVTRSAKVWLRKAG